MNWWDEFNSWDILIKDVSIDGFQIDEKFHSIGELWIFLKGYFYGRSGDDK